MALQEGTNIGPYRIIGQLGQGGMATVYKAYHPQLDRYVAIKIMHQAFLEDESFLARFIREAQIVARLEHPHIIPVFDSSEHEGIPYLVMKFVQGRTLKAHLNKGALSLQQIAHIMSTVGSALNYAHQQGVLHRDIKPSNIIIDNENTPYLTDFGLARMAQAGESTMSVDMLLGTPHYISPEQARGRQNLDGRTDIYSLGVVLYELVVGRVPFSADTPFAIIHDHIYSPLPLPTAVNPDIPPRIEQVLLKALAKEPTDRFETATDMVKAFQDAIQQDKVKELKPDRVSVAAVSLARLREQQLQGLAAQPTPSGIPAPVVPGSTASHNKANPHSGQLWMLGGLITFLFICFLSTAITLGAAGNLQQLAALDETTNQPQKQPEHTEQSLPLQSSAPALYDVPTRSIAEAQEAIENTPEDAIAYLALAKAYWQEDKLNAARNAVREGMEFTEDSVHYQLTAANTAAETDQTGDAAALYIIATNTAQDKESYPFAYALASEYLYQLALESEDFHPLETLQTIIAETEIRNIDTDSQLIRLTTARAQITNGQIRRAELILNKLLAENNTRPETHLVLGELYQAQNNPEKAISEWEFASKADPVLEWVHNRALELIESIEE